MRSAATRLLLPALACVAAAGCGGGGSTCGTAAGELPEGLEILSAHSADIEGSIRGAGFNITVNGRNYDFDEEPMVEGVRFDIDRPARVHGFTVTWSNLDNYAEKEVDASLYADFGHNGFDFWRPAPLWTGSRCQSDMLPLSPIEYVLEEPMEITQPGLLYVGHPALAVQDPTFAFDEDGNGNCALFDDCHSAIELPDAEENQFFDGVSLPFPYDFMVDLHVEWIGDPPTKTVFELVQAPTIGLRAAWGDFDNDGWDDILTNGPTLLRNTMGTGFVDVSAPSGLLAMGIIGAGTWGDYDNDGCLDMYVSSSSGSQKNSLVHSNCDGTFTDVTVAAGNVSGLLPSPFCDNGLYAPSEAASWIDIDSDGFLDIYLSTYNCALDLTDFVDYVFHNEGNGTFTDWTGTRGFLATATATRGASPIDYDADGDVDLHVHNYVLERELFYLNNGDGTVSEIGETNGLSSAGTIFQGTRYYSHTLGTAWGDLDNDGDFDLVESNLAHPRFYQFSDKTRVLLNAGGTFTDNAGDWSFPAGANGLRYQETHTVPVLADFDQDGVLDLTISARYDGRPTDFYWGDGDGTFELDVLRAGLTIAKSGWGMAQADFDHDGDPDLATSPLLFRNVLEPRHGELFPRTLGKGNWLQVHAVGNVASNRAAIGATVRVTAGGETYLRHVQGGTGQGCQDSFNLHFGLGSTDVVDSIQVAFPGGATVTYAGPFSANQRLWLYENATVIAGWSAPP